MKNRDNDKSIVIVSLVLGVMLFITILASIFSRYELTVTKTVGSTVISLHHALLKDETTPKEVPVQSKPFVRPDPFPVRNPGPVVSRNEEDPLAISEEEMADEVAHVSRVLPLVREVCAARLACLKKNSSEKCSLDKLSVSLKDSDGELITSNRLEASDHTRPIMLDDKWGIYKDIKIDWWGDNEENITWMFMRAPYGGRNQWFTRFIVGDTGCTLQTNGNHRKGVELMKQVFPDFAPCPPGRWCTLRI